MGSIAVLVSDSDLGAPQFMILAFHKLYFWTLGSDDLLYVTELYSLARILRRMNENFSGLRTKPLQPLSQHSPPHEPLYHSFWFWEVPKGWSQNLSKPRDLQDVVLGCYEYGLPHSVPILVSEGGSGSSGSTEFLLKCGEEYYLFYEISSYLVHIDEPTGLHEILRALDIKLRVDLKTTRVDLLPEFGGPNVIADKDVPEGWSNKFQKADCGDVFYEHGIIARTILLFHNGSLDGTSLCLAEAATDSYYIWNRSSNEIFRIDKADGLQDILDILKTLSRHLSLARIEARRHSHGHETTAKEVSAMKRKD